MFFVYILWSEKLQKFYIGSTQDLQARVAYHNSGNVTFTSTGIPWVIVYSEALNSRQEAILRERQIKGWKSAKAIKKLIETRLV